MQPVRKVLSATHFKALQARAEDGSMTVKWTPCSPGDATAVEKTWNDVSSDELQEPPLVVSSCTSRAGKPWLMCSMQLADFQRAIKAIKPSVTPESIKAHLDFAQEAGSD